MFLSLSFSFPSPPLPLLSLSDSVTHAYPFSLHSSYVGLAATGGLGTAPAGVQPETLD